MRLPTDIEIDTEERVMLVALFLDVQVKLPELYKTKTDYFKPSEEQICKIFIPSYLEVGFLTTFYDSRLDIWIEYIEMVLGHLEGLSRRILNSADILSPKSDLVRLITPLKQKYIAFKKTMYPSINPSLLKNDEQKIFEQQRKLNEDINFTGKLEKIKIISAEKRWTPRTIFISYAWPDDDELEPNTKQFVNIMYSHLREAGLIPIIDQIQSCAGIDMNNFMINNINEAHHILVICDSNMKKKFEEEEGGPKGVTFEYIYAVKRWQEENRRNPGQQDRLIIPICLNRQKYVPGLIAKLAEVSMYPERYEESIKFMIAKIYGFDDAKEFYEIWNNIVIQSPSSPVVPAQGSQQKPHHPSDATQKNPKDESLLSSFISSQPTPKATIPSKAATRPLPNTPGQETKSLTLAFAKSPATIPSNNITIPPENPTLPIVETSQTKLHLKYRFTNIKDDCENYLNRTNLEKELAEKIKQDNIIVLCGEPGSGKTKLATYFSLKKFITLKSITFVYKIPAYSIRIFKLECIYLAKILKSKIEPENDHTLFNYESAIEYIIRVFKNEMSFLLYIDKANNEDVTAEMKKILPKLTLGDQKKVLITTENANLSLADSSTEIKYAVIKVGGLEIEDIKTYIKTNPMKPLESASDSIIVSLVGYFNNRAIGTINALLCLAHNQENMEPIQITAEKYLDTLKKSAAENNKKTEIELQQAAIWYSINKCNGIYNKNKTDTDCDFNLVLKIMSHLSFLPSCPISVKNILEPLVYKICNDHQKTPKITRPETVYMVVKYVTALLSKYSIINCHEFEYITIHPLVQHTMMSKLKEPEQSYKLTLLAILTQNCDIKASYDKINFENVLYTIHHLETIYLAASDIFTKNRPFPSDETSLKLMNLQYETLQIFKKRSTLPHSWLFSFVFGIAVNLYKNVTSYEQLRLLISLSVYTLGAQLALLTNEEDQCKSHFEEAIIDLKRSNVPGAKKCLAFIKHNIAILYLNHLKTEVNLQIALELCQDAAKEKSLEKIEKIEILFTLGKLYHFHKMFVLAIKKYEKALRIIQLKTDCSAQDTELKKLLNEFLIKAKLEQTENNKNSGTNLKTFDNFTSATNRHMLFHTPTMETNKSLMKKFIKTHRPDTDTLTLSTTDSNLIKQLRKKLIEMSGGKKNENIETFIDDQDDKIYFQKTISADEYNQLMENPNAFAEFVKKEQQNNESSADKATSKFN